MIRTKMRALRVPIWGLMPLIAATLVICVLILVQMMSPNPLGCRLEMLETPAVYLEHIGDEDKPIDSIVISATRPYEKELGCGSRRLWMSPRIFLVKDEELAEASKLLKGSKPRGERTEPREFRYVLVSKPGMVESGILDVTQSHDFLMALAKYFDGRQPEFHAYLTSRRF